jgi:hypothetical protein
MRIVTERDGGGDTNSLRTVKLQWAANGFQVLEWWFRGRFVGLSQGDSDVHSSLRWLILATVVCLTCTRFVTAFDELIAKSSALAQSRVHTPDEK